MTRASAAALRMADEIMADHPELGGDAQAEPITDSHLAERLAGEVLAGSYCWARGLGWMAWRGDRWAAAPDQEVREVARAWMVGQYQQFLDEADEAEIAAQGRAWLTQLSQFHVKAVVTLAEGIVLRDAADFDTYPDLLNCANGVVDLRTGELLPHDPALMLTKSTGIRYIPGAAHQDWDQALTALPEDIRGWYQVRIGQGATGYMPPDDMILINQGGGENGKTTVLQGIRHALGDYYVQVPVKALYGDPSQHDTVLMPFRGARIAAVEETPEKGYLNVQQVKMLTSPQITARYMRHDYVEFEVSHALMVNTNYEPIVEGADHGTWRRLPLVKYPYTYLKPGQPRRLPTHRAGDPGLRDRVIAGEQGQHEAVLAWMVEGARQWYAAGKGTPPLPERVVADTAAWRGRANLLYGFAAEHLEPSTEHHLMADELYEFFDQWVKAGRHKSWTKETFFGRLRDHAVESSWDIEKKYTKRRMDRLSRPPHDILPPPKESYQAWHGLKFKPDPAWQEDADSQDGEHRLVVGGAVAEVPDLPRSVDEQSQVSKVSGKKVPPNARAGDGGTVRSETPETLQVSGLTPPGAPPDAPASCALSADARFIALAGA